MNLITFFDRTYPKDKQMEGIAISQAIVSGECFKCPHYKRCSSDETFRFPLDSACMKRKNKKIPTCTRGIETIGTSGTDLCILAIWDFEKPNLKFSQLFPAVPKVD